MGSRSPRGKFGSYLNRAKKRAASEDAGIASMNTRPPAGETAFDRDRAAGITRPDPRDRSKFFDREDYVRVFNSARRRDGGRGRARRRFADRMRRRSRRAPGRSSYQTRSRSPFAGRRGRER